MPAGTYAPRSYKTGLYEFYFSDMRGLLDINSSPQETADNALTIAQNVYGRNEGGVQCRKGMTAKGGIIGGAPAHTDGLYRFFQTVIDAVPQNPAVAVTLEQCGGNLYNADTQAQIGGANVLGANALPWSACQAFDASHLLPVPAAPTNAAPVAGGSLAAGTYLVSVSWLNAVGETLVGADDLIAITLNQKVTINQPAAPPIGATGWRVYASTAGGGHGTETLQAATIPIGTTTFLFTTLVAGAALPVANTAVAASDVFIAATGSGGPYLYDGNAVSTPADWTTFAAGARWCVLVGDVLYFAGLPSQPNQVVAMLLGKIETFGFVFNFSLPVTGLGTVGQGTNSAVVVGMSQGIGLIIGYGINTYQTTEIDSNDGVAAGRTMQTINGLCYFLGSTDYYVCDGVSLQGLGINIRPWILNDPLAVNQFDLPMNGDRTKSWSLYYNNRIYTFYDSTQEGVPNAGVVYDLKLGGWTSYAGPKLNCGCLLNAPQDAEPPAVLVGDSKKAQIYNFDVYNGNGHMIDDAGTPIYAFASSKFFKIGLPDAPKVARRVYPELFVETFDGTLTLTTDYGATRVAEILTGQANAGAVWDVSNWDASSWSSSGYLQFVNQRGEFNTPFEALSIGIVSQDTNPPWVWQGAKLVYIQQPSR
jgi:hypothetical protein